MNRNHKTVSSEMTPQIARHKWQWAGKNAPSTGVRWGHKDRVPSYCVPTGKKL